MIEPKVPFRFLLVALLAGAIRAQDVVLFPQPAMLGFLDLDVNGDGIKDSVGVGYDGLQMRLGQGNGIFGPEIEIEAPPLDFTLFGDVTGDGQPDIVAHAHTLGALVVLPGEPGSFGAPIENDESLFNYVNAQQLADLNGDGLLDWVGVSSDAASTLYVALSEGAGHFGAVSTSPVVGVVRTIAISDFNGDGHLDLASATDYEQQVAVRLGTGDGSLSTTPIESPLLSSTAIFATNLAATDFDNDGLTDLIAVSYVAGSPPPPDGGQVMFLRADGGGSFDQRATVAIPTFGLPVVGDVNGDGAQDVVVSFASATLGLATLLGDGTGGLQAPVLSGCAQAGASELLDVDGDGRLDASMYSSVAFGQGDGTFVGSPAFVLGQPGNGAQTRGLGSADMNGDGFRDVVATRRKKDKGLLVLLGHGDMTFEAHEPAAPGSTEIALGDLDSDGYPDAVITGKSATQILLNDGSGVGFAGPTTALDFPADGVRLADLDGDGALDLLASYDPASELLLLHGDGHGALGAPQGLALDGMPIVVEPLDIDGDGTVDIAAALYAQPSLEILDGLGAGAFGTPQVVALPIEPDTFAFADLDGDGALDLAVAFEDPNGHSLHLLFAQSPGVFGTSVEGPPIDNIEQLAAADFDRDGLIDLLALRADSELDFFRNTGLQTLAAPTQTTTGFAQRMIVDDFNGDDRPDVALQSSTANLVRVVPNVLPNFPNLGYQHTASFGTPHLQVTGAPVPGQKVTFAVTGVPPQSVGFLFAGLDFAPHAFNGGTLVPSPDVAVPMLAGVPLSGRWPDLPAGTAVYVQAWLAKGAGIAGSNAVMAVTQ